MFVTCCLLLFFAVILMFQLIGEREGFDGEYQKYDETPAILEQKNAGNIQVIKDQLDTLTPLSADVADLKKRLTTLEGQVGDIALAQQQYTTGLTTPDITGT